MDVKKDDSFSLSESSNRCIDSSPTFLLKCLLYRVQFTMGTSRKYRVKGIGKILLHKSLKSMKEIGYEYAIIGQAGPIEFYEKNCNAKLIPSNNLLKYHEN